MIKPTLALIPSAYKLSTVYSVLPSDGVGDFDFTRAGEATRINKDGLIELVSNNIPRLNYPLIDGVVSGCPSLLLEPSKQNVLQRSQEFDNSYWVNNGADVLANQIISPDGTQNADLLTGVVSDFGIIVFSKWSATNNVASCFAKKGSSNLFVIKNGSGVGGVTFNLENGIISSISSGFEGEIENYGNGWFRCTAIDTLGRSGTFSLGVTAAGESVYIWGAQLESGFKTSYIPTTSGTATREEEICNNSGNADVFNGVSGVLFAEINTLSDSGVKAIAITDGTVDNIITIRYNNSVAEVLYVNSANSTTYQINHTLTDVKDFIKIALSYQSGSLKMYINGALIQNIDLVVNDLPNWSKLQFDIGNGTQDFYGNTKQLQYFDTVLTNTDLEELTSWRSFNEMARDLLYTIL